MPRLSLALVLACAAACGERRDARVAPGDIPVPSTPRAVASSAPTPPRDTPAIVDVPPPAPSSGEPWSPDGRRVALGTAILDVESLALSPFDCEEKDGRVVWASPTRVACDRYGKTVVWSLDAGTRREFPEASEPRFLQRGAVLALQSQGSREMQFFDVDRGERVGAPQPSPPDTFWQFSPDGTSAISVAVEGATALVRVPSGERVVIGDDGPSRSPAGPYPFVLFAPDATRAAIPRRRGGGVWLVDVPGRKVVQTITAPRCDDASTVAWSPDGKLLAVGTNAGEVCVFDATTWRVLRTFRVPSHAHLKGPVTRVNYLQITPSGRGILAGTDEPMGPTGISYATLYRVDTGKAQADLGIVYVPVLEIAGGGLLANGLDKPRGVVARDLSLKDLQLGENDGIDAPVSPDGAWIALRDGTIASTSSTKRIALEGAADCKLIAFDKAGTKLLGDHRGAAKIWDVQSGKVIFTATASQACRIHGASFPVDRCDGRAVKP